MICLVSVILFSGLFHVYNNEQPQSSCLPVKPMKTKNNSCASFNDVCLKKDDKDCESFLNVCAQCPPHNMTLLMMKEILDKLKEYDQRKWFFIIIGLVGVNILIVLLVGKFKISNKLFRFYSREPRVNYSLIETNQNLTNRENNEISIEDLNKLQENIKGYINLKVAELKSSKNPSGNLIILKCLFGNSDPVIIEFTNDDLVSHLTDQMKDKSKLSDCMLLLIKKDLYLEEDKPIKEYNLAKGSVIKYCNFMRFENANISIGTSSIKENASDIIEAVRTTQNKSVTLKRYQCSNRNHLIESKAVRMEIIAFQKLKSHPRFVQLCGLYFDDHFLYVEMGRMPNRSLREHIKLKWYFPEKSIAKWVKQILDGVSHLHTNNIVHRNLRSSDIYLDEKEDIKINGFDFSKYWMEGGDDSFINQVVKDNSISYRYMSPDFIGGESPIFADDVWSIGAILVELVTGLRPYDDFTETAAMKEISKSRKIVYETPRQGISDNLRNFMDSCLQGNVEDRATVAQLLEHDFMKSHV